MYTLNLRTKFVSMFIALILIQGLIIITLIHTILSEKLTAELQKRGIFIAEHIAEASINLILTENIFPLKLLVLNQKKHKENIEYIFILDHQKKILAHTFGDSFPLALKNSNIVPPQYSHQIQPLHVEKGKLFDIAVPILNGGVGEVHVGMLEAPIRESIREIVEQIIWAIFALLIMGSIVAIIFATSITKPILELTEGTRIIGSGNLEYKIAVKTNDEIGQLATSFSNMSEKLKIVQTRERFVRIGAISAGVAHTVRNPLHGAINCTEILQKRLAQDDMVAHEMCDLLMEGLHRIEKVTKRLLVLTRDVPLQKRETDINSLISDALSFIETRAHKKNIRLIEQMNDLPILSIDPDRFSEALINFFENALDACQEGDTVSIKTEIQNAGRSGISIWIEDNGKGIPDEDMPNIFDPFFTTKPIGKGTGLGMSIAQRIIEEHEGELKLKSTEGQGTCIQVFLPAESA